MPPSLTAHHSPLTDHLAPEVAGHVGDMNPAAVALKDKLGELDAPLLLHLLYHLEQAAVVGAVATDDVRCAAEDMVAILGTAHKRVELLAAIPAAHNKELNLTHNPCLYQINILSLCHEIKTLDTL